MKKLILQILLVLLGCTSLWAADFWDKKGYKEWKEKEVLKMLSKSPWAQNVNLDSNQFRSGAFKDAFPDAPGGGGAIGGMGGGGGLAGGGGGGGSGSGVGSGGIRRGRRGPPPIKLTVRWVSALPVKQAMVRSRHKGNFEETEQEQKFLKETNKQYVVSISPLPSKMARGLLDTDLIQEVTSLYRKNKEPILAESVKVLTREGFAELILFFPRIEEITLDNKNVELRTELGPAKIKRKFKLKDMRVQRKLEL